MLSLTRNPQGSESDFRVEIERLVKLAQPYLPITEPEQLTIDYLKWILGNKALQKHLFMTGASSIASTVLAIESYLAVEDEGIPACWATQSMADADKATVEIPSTLAKQS